MTIGESGLPEENRDLENLWPRPTINDGCGLEGPLTPQEGDLPLGVNASDEIVAYGSHMADSESLRRFHCPHKELGRTPQPAADRPWLRPISWVYYNNNSRED